MMQPRGMLFVLDFGMGDVSCPCCILIDILSHGLARLSSTVKSTNSSNHDEVPP